MSVQELDAVKAKITSLPPMHAQSVEGLRILYDKAERAFPVGPGVAVERVMAHGVAAERLTPAGADRTACLLYLHGGGYAIGSARSHRHLAADLARRAGIAALVPDYRLAPEHPSPAAVDDAVAAYRSLLDQGLAPGRIAIAGDSAGGGLTIACLLAAHARGLPMPGAAACLSPWTDMTASGASHRTKAAVDVLCSAPDIARWRKAYVPDDNWTAPLVSPALAELGHVEGLPPLLIQVGTDEILLDEARLLAAKVKSTGTSVTLEEWPGMIHVWHWYWPVLEEGRQANTRIAAFLRAHLTSAAAG